MILRPLLICFLLAVVLSACVEEETIHINGMAEEEVLELRAAKDEMFKGEYSPLPPDIRQEFKGLPYFDVDAEYAVEAEFMPLVAPDTVSMATSSSEMRRAVRIGRFVFNLRGKSCSLFAFRFLPSSSLSLFIPFTDRTNGVSTYRAGRYLDLEWQEDEEDATLDFNLAYNPYCAYDANYSCPIVPSENDLPVAVEAGEKK